MSYGRVEEGGRQAASKAFQESGEDGSKSCEGEKRQPRKQPKKIVEEVREENPIISRP